MQKNVASQKLIVFAFDSTTNLPKTGDAANLTAYVSIDYGAVTVLGDTSATEMDATNAKGYYLFDLTQGETNGNTLLFSAKSSTANIVVVGAPAAIQTVPAAFVAVGGAAGGLFIAGSNAATTVATWTCTGLETLGNFTNSGTWTQTGATTYTGAVTGTNASNDFRVNGAVPGAAGGLFIAGTNAATSITTALTTTFTGNLTGSVASVTGAVGSVTGAVGSVTGAVGSVTARVTANTDQLGGQTVTASGGIAFQNGTVATTTNITAGVITTVTNLTNAPTNGDFTAVMKTSLNSATPTLSASGSAALTEGYRANGATGTIAQLLYEILAHVSESAIVTTVKTINKLDHVTPAATFALDSATAPTSITRAT